MKLSLEFIYTRLKSKKPGIIRKFPSRTEPTLMCAGIIGGKVKPSPEVLYIDFSDSAASDTNSTSNETVNQILPQYKSVGCTNYHTSSLSVIAKQGKESTYANCDAILVPNNTNMLALMQTVSEIFIEMEQWADSLARAVASGENLQSIVNLTAPLLKNPLYFADTSFKQIAQWGGDIGYTSPIWKYQAKYRYLPYTVMQALIEHGDLDKLFNTRKAWIAKTAGFTSPFISKALYNNEKHLGNLLICEYYHKFDHCDLEIAEYLGNFISSAMVGGRSYIETSSLYNAHFIEELICGHAIDNQIIKDQLKARKWNNNDGFFIAIYEAAQEREAVKHHIMTLLSTQLNVQCLEYDNNIVIIVNTKSTKTETAIECLRRIGKSFKRNLALSEEFELFTTLEMFYRQAMFALGTIQEGEKPQVVRYSSVYLDDAAQLLLQHIPVSRKAQKLAEYDKAHHTQLCHTLLVWLTLDRNSSKAADELYIHRNTLLKRLARVEQVLDLDLSRFDDYQFKSRMVMSLISLANSGE